MKAIYDKLSKFYEREIAGCSCCREGEIGWIYDKHGDEKVKMPCPTCAPLRERLKAVQFHHIKGHHSGRNCACGIRISAIQSGPHPCDDKLSPNLTTHLTGSKPTVRVLLEEAKLWDDFADWHFYKQCECKSIRQPNSGTTYYPNGAYKAAVEILTDFEYLCQAVDSFLQEILNGMD